MFVTGVTKAKLELNFNDIFLLSMYDVKAHDQGIKNQFRLCSAGLMPTTKS
jgi:hypothetical protein